jgi:bifunctional DNA-binding transcriptional regulator/antitoxin component of YhaV-PrlF toxin-antitoxin module
MFLTSTILIRMTEYILTLTSKGQFTMPVAVRRAMNLNSIGDKLTMTFNNNTKQAKIEKPITALEVQQIARKYLKNDIKPLQDPRKFYETRPVRL